VPTSPYGSSKLMTEIMLRDVGAAHGLQYMILRYFNVAGADPLGRSGQSTKGAAHLIKVAVETALGLRPTLSVSAPTIRRRTAPASEITFTSPILLPRTATRSPICAPAAPPPRSIAATAAVFPYWK
jgi:thioester reductase-like protein